MKYFFLMWGALSFPSMILSVFLWIRTGNVGDTFMYELIFIIGIGIYTIIDAIDKKKL